MDKSTKSRWAWASLLVCGPLLVTLFQNCGQVFEAPVVDLASSGGNIQFSGSCDADLMNLYQRTYFPFLKQNCGSCHTNGPGSGQFGHSDFTTSFNAFRGITRARVERNAVNPSHQPPFTGSQHQTTVDSYSTLWAAAESAYNSCTGSNTGVGIASLGKSTPLILQRAATPTMWTRMEWDLHTETADTSIRNQIPLIVGIEARVATVNGVRQGYEFRNPTVRLKTGYNGPYRVIGLKIRINGQRMDDVSTYVLADYSINSTTDTNIAPNSAYALAVIANPADTDAFAIEFADIRNSSGGTVGGGGTTPPPPTPTLPTRVTLTQLLSSDPMLGVFQQSCVGCHRAGNANGGLDLTNVAQARATASEILARMNNAGNPMPRAGLLMSEKRELVRIWVDGGAPQ